MNPEENNSNKLLFKIGIIIIIVVISFLWLSNLRQVFESQEKTNNQTWQKINADMNKSLDELDEITNKLSASSSENNFVEGLLDKADSIKASSSTSTKLEIKEELSELIKKSPTTTPNAATKINCPEFINCMPSIGETRPCSIPVGCENITQIAY